LYKHRTYTQPQIHTHTRSYTHTHTQTQQPHLLYVIELASTQHHSRNSPDCPSTHWMSGSFEHLFVCVYLLDSLPVCPPVCVHSYVCVCVCVRERISVCVCVTVWSVYAPSLSLSVSELKGILPLSLRGLFRPMVISNSPPSML